MATSEYPDYPQGQDPSAVFAERLAQAQTQGLPLSATVGMPGLGNPGQQRPALAPVQVQRPPVGMAEGVGRMLEGFGAGYRGQLAPWEQIQLAEQDRALRQQQLAQQQQMMEAQLPHLQAQTALTAVDTFTKLSAMMQEAPEDQRGRLADMFAPLMVGVHSMVTAGEHGVQAAPLDLETAKEILTTPGRTQEWLKNQQDAAPADLAAARGMKPAEAMKFLAERRKERVTALLPQVQQEVGKYVEQLKAAAPGTTLTVPQVEQGIEGALAAAPDDALTQQYGVTKTMARDAIAQWLADAKSKQFLQERGVAVGGQTPRELGIEGVADYVQKNPRFIKAGVTIGNFGTLDPALRGQILTEAKAAQQADVQRQASLTGYAGAVASAQARADEPLIQSMPTQYPVDVKTEQPVDRASNSLASIKKMGGEKAVRFLDAKQYDAFTSTKELQGIISQFIEISKVLTDRPGANFGQALSYYAKTKLGQDNPGVAFDALQGASLRVARAMQGSSQSLSNLDLKSIAGMLPSTTDTVQTALHRLEIAAKITDNMKNVTLGKASTTDLMTQLKQAHAEVNAGKTPEAQKFLQPGERIIEGPDGVRKKAPGAGKLPPGWREVKP